MRTEAQNTHGIVGWGASTDTQKFHVRINNNAANGELGAIRTEVQGGQNVASTPIDDGEWHHVAVIFPEGGEFNSDVIHVVDGEIEEQSGGGDQVVDTLIGPGAEPVTIGMRVQGVARFQKGEEVLLFLEKAGSGFKVLGLSQGKLTIIKDENSGKKMAFRENQGLTVKKISGQLAPMDKIGPTELKSFLDQIRMILEDVHDKKSGRNLHD